jgi:hypothetical protein
MNPLTLGLVVLSSQITGIAPRGLPPWVHLRARCVHSPGRVHPLQDEVHREVLERPRFRVVLSEGATPRVSVCPETSRHGLRRAPALGLRSELWFDRLLEGRQ